MQSPKNYVILALALTTIAGGVLAWKQHQELTVLRAQLLGRDERADWQKRLWDAEKRRTDLEKQLAAQKPPAAPPEEGPFAEAPASPAAGATRRDRRADFMAMMDQPEMQRLMSIQQKAGLDSRYASLFKSLNLTPEQLEKFKNLLVEKRTAMMDVLAAAREQGINPRTNRAAFEKLVSDSQTEIDDTIRSTLGDSAFSQYQAYEKTLPERTVVGQLEQRLSYSSTPLSDSQAEQLVSILSTTTSSRAANSSFPMPMPIGGMGGPVSIGGTPHITDATINQSLGVLAGPQVDALKALQQEQQAQAELSAAMREQFRQNHTSGSTTATPPPPPPPDGG